MNAPQRHLRIVAQSAKPDPIFGGRPRAELEFLPAALEVMETPPPPLPRIMALALVSLLVVTLAWAGLSHVDVVTTASGRLVPTGGGKIVQPLEAGTVSAIHVRDGAFVHTGDVLVELEPTEARADQERLTGELAAARLDVARLRSIALGERFQAPLGAAPAAAVIAEREATAEIAGNRAKLQGLSEQATQHRAELDGARAEADRLRTLVPITEQRSAVFEALARQGYGSRLQLLDAQEKQQDTTKSLEVQRQRLPQIQASISGAERERAQAAAEEAKTDLSALKDAQVKADSLVDELRKAQEQVKARTLFAPADGSVQELAIHTIGGVVAPGQTLMRIAPSAAGLEVEAKLLNRDVGFVHAGMPAEIKVETFPFTRYGVIHATVVNVSRDAIADASQPQPTQQTQAEASSEDQHYLVRLQLSRTTMNIDGQTVRLTPGMVVSAEIRTGRRRVAEYILSPLEKSTAEAGRER
jgi:hemolysin D